MKTIFIEGASNSGKTTIIKEYSEKLLTTGEYDIVFSHKVDTDELVYLLKNRDTGDCILLNSPADMKGLIDELDRLLGEFTSTYTITIMISAIRHRNVNRHLFERMHSVAKKYSTDIKFIDLLKNAVCYGMSELDEII